MRDTKNLRVLQRAHELAIHIDAITSGARWRRRTKLQAQLRAAAESVPANIAEGCGHSSRKEFARFLQKALASNAETRYHLKFARDIDVVSFETHAQIDSENIEIRRMLGALLRRVRDELSEDEDELSGRYRAIG